MRYFILILGIIILGWGAWVIFTDRPGETMATGDEFCGQMTNSGRQWLDCQGSFLKSSEELSNNAKWAIGIGAVLTVFSGLLIWDKKQG